MEFFPAVYTRRETVWLVYWSVETLNFWYSESSWLTINTIGDQLSSMGWLTGTFLIVHLGNVLNLQSTDDLQGGASKTILQQVHAHGYRNWYDQLKRKWVWSDFSYPHTLCMMYNPQLTNLLKSNAMRGCSVSTELHDDSWRSMLRKLDKVSVDVKM